MIGDEAGILTAGGVTEAPVGTTPADEAARTGVPVGSPFADAAGARLLTAAEGRATATMTIPAWLAGPTPGGGLGTAAVAALAEIAMGAAGNAGLAADELTQTAALQLHTRGPAEGWPGLGAAAPAVSVFAPAPAAARTRRRQVELRAEARVQDTEADEAGAPLRRVTATVSTPGGRPLATASAIRAVVRSTSADRDRAEDAAGLAHRAGPTGCGEADAATRQAPDGLVRHRPPSHPLLAELAADVDHDGDQVTLRLAPPAWLANRLGRVHTAASCALVEAAIGTVLARRLPTGSTVHTLSLDLTVVRSLTLEAEVTAVATVRHLGRRLAVVDVEVGQAAAPPSVLGRATVSRTSHRLSQP
ncbi:PaaI family thioesterase [Pseudofrankia inefficax]|uniref:Thioesterase superfamily protein n=1 Tax=Pseudofrankia inefficax (strain DSM 45817 / CECT 9037 / DDB 130130 / EuI1c) TaxID=298654 RepID=E3IZK4_PSEI1|nr:PaaI family thioesterase [Pseudofrankia inefficax]ADP82774.1 thioesterase superfamily protein [Pseudofrankia inefficax]